MGYTHVFRTIESHTGGNPTRTIVSGVPRLQGATMMDKMRHMEKDYDWIRQALMYEPRGHSVMSGCVLTEPTTPGADLGVIFIEVGGYLPMCGHDTIGLVTALVESGQVPADGPEVELRLDTPAGRVTARAILEAADGAAAVAAAAGAPNGASRVREVRFDNVPAFVLHRDVVLDFPETGPVSLDIAWGGNFYGILPAAPFGLDLSPAGVARAVAWAKRIRAAADAAVETVHPAFPHVRGLTHVEFYENRGTTDDGLPLVRNMVVVPGGGVDRSPCGTGTSAKAAVLHARGALPLGGSFVHESITGARFRATVLEACEEAGLPAVRPRIAGSASVFGDSTFVVDPRDPLRNGFLLI